MEKKSVKISTFLYILVLCFSFLSVGLFALGSAENVIILNNPPPQNFEFNVGINEANCPTQSAWCTHRLMDPAPLQYPSEIVAEKPIAVIVNTAKTQGYNLILKVEHLDTGQTDDFSTLVDATGLAVFTLILNITGDYTFSIPDLLSLGVVPIPVSVVDTRPLNLYWGVMQPHNKNVYTVPGAQDWLDHVSTSSIFLEKVYPTNEVYDSFDEGNLDYTQVEVKIKKNIYSDCVKVGTDALAKGYEIGIAVADQNYFIYREMPGAAGVSFGPSCEGVIVANKYPTAAAHEVGHIFVLYWTTLENYDLYPPYGSTASGLDPEAETWRTGYDFMGAAAYDTTSYSWTNNTSSYNHLFTKLSDPKYDPEIAIVSGIFSKDGIPLEITERWAMVKDGIISNPPSGDYLIRFVDNSNNAIGNDTSFAISYFMSVNKGFTIDQPILTDGIIVYNPNTLLGNPFEALHYPIWPAVERWDLALATEQPIVLAQPGPCPDEGLNPLVTDSYYDLAVYGAVFDTLAKLRNPETLEIEPGLAQSWSVADDDKTWTVNLKQGIKWHDGVDFTAEDVKFTYASAMEDDLASHTKAFIKTVLGSADNIEIVDPYTLIFHLPNPSSLFESKILTEGYGWMLPKHVLKEVPFDEWRSHPFNTGEGSYESNGKTAYGPIGCGPYRFMFYDPTTFTNYMEKFEFVSDLGVLGDYWNTDALEADGLYEIQEYRVQFIEGSDAAITSLKAGDVDVLDSQYHLETKLDSFEPSWADWTHFEVYEDPRIGTIETDKAPFVFAVATPDEDFSAIQLIDNRDPESPSLVYRVLKDQLERIGYITPVFAIGISILFLLILIGSVICLVWLYRQ